MKKFRFLSVCILIVAGFLGYFVYSTENSESKYAFKLGLDLSGGTHLVYSADTSNLDSSDVEDAMQTLRDVIERRVNLFGVSEPIVQTETGLSVSGNIDHRLIVELPGITDTEEAIKRIGETPTLEFKLQRSEEEVRPILDVRKKLSEALQGGTEPNLTQEEQDLLSEDLYIDTALTGRFLERAQVLFDSTTNQPYVQITFNEEGSDLFAEITRENIGNVLAIFLDSSVISNPVVQEEISGGIAQITGQFNPVEARDLARNLNYGALPLPIELLNTQTIGPSLGKNALDSGLKAGVIGLALVLAFMILWYRLSGLVAVLSLSIYLILMLAIFKLVPITLTAAGIAGFILSVGMAVDANVLIFERYKENRKNGNYGSESIKESFNRAWPAIRDGNVTSILTAIVLFYAGTFLTQSFAVTFGLGVIVSMFSAITITRTFMLAIGVKGESGVSKFLLNSGIKN